MGTELLTLLTKLHAASHTRSSPPTHPYQPSHASIPTGNSTYEGEVYDGYRHGYGVYRRHGSLITYAGDWRRGRRHGKGRIDYQTPALTAATIDDNGESDTGGDNGGDNGGAVTRGVVCSYYDGDWCDDIKHGYG